jgi:hypothetical protein
MRSLIILILGLALPLGRALEPNLSQFCYPTIGQVLKKSKSQPCDQPSSGHKVRLFIKLFKGMSFIKARKQIIL